jgi:hypothetical protein
MNQTFVSLAVAMMVPAVAVIFVVVEERKRVPKEPTIAEIVLVIPALATCAGCDAAAVVLVAIERATT